MIPSAVFAKSPRVGSRATAHDEFQVAFDRGKLGSCLIGLPQRKDVLV